MQRVRCANVDSVDFRIAQKSSIIAGCACNADFIAERSCLLIARCSDRGYLDVTEAPDTLGVDAPHESRAKHGRFQLLHSEDRLRVATNRTHKCIAKQPRVSDSLLEQSEVDFDVG